MVTVNQLVLGFLSMVCTIVKAGKAIVNGDGKALGKIAGGEAANTFVGLATAGIGVATEAAAVKGIGALKGCSTKMTSLYREVNESHPGFANIT